MMKPEKFPNGIEVRRGDDTSVVLDNGGVKPLSDFNLEETDNTEQESGIVMLTVIEAGDYTVTDTDRTILNKSTDGVSEPTFTLPSASSSKNRVLRFVVWNQSNHFNFNLPVLDMSYGSDMSSNPMRAGGSVTIQSDGSDWYQID